MLEKTEKFLTTHHPTIIPYSTSTLDHLMKKMVGGTSCASVNNNVFDYTVRNFISSPSDQRVINTSLQGGFAVLPSTYFTNVEHKSYSSKHLSSTNYNDISTTNIRPAIPSTFVGAGTKSPKMLSIKDTTTLLKQKQLMHLIGKGNVKMFNILFNHNVNRFLQNIKRENSQKISKKHIDEVFKKLTSTR